MSDIQLESGKIVKILEKTILRIMVKLTSWISPEDVSLRTRPLTSLSVTHRTTWGRPKKKYVLPRSTSSVFKGIICHCSISASLLLSATVREKCPYYELLVSILRAFLILMFAAFGLNTERYGVSFRIQSECVKIWTRKTLRKMLETPIL